MKRFAFVACVACGGAPSPGARVPASATVSYPEVARLFVHNAQNDFCLGVLVRRRVVLTAAHCVAFNPSNSPDGIHGSWTVEFPMHGLRVRTSAYRLVDERMRAQTRESYFAHPEIVDVALLLLDEDVDIVPAVLDAAGRSDIGTVIRRAAPRPISDLIATSPVQIRLLERDMFVTERVTAPGDSGGPFFRKGTHELLGIEARFDESTERWSMVSGLGQWLDASR